MARAIWTFDRRPGPLEEDVLEEVRETLARRRFVPRPRADEEAQGERAHVMHLVDEDGDSVFESVLDDHPRLQAEPRF